jgi:hypothetical protein
VPTRVTVDNFARAETDRMFAAIARDAGGVNRWVLNRQPTPIDHQPVIRQNRDTLYSGAILDISAGATLTLPDAGGRYQSAMVVNGDHYIERIFHEAGDHELTVEQFGTPYVLVAVRTLVDPEDPTDVAAVNDLQDRLVIRASSARPFVPEAYDQESLDATRTALLTLARGLDGFRGAFGKRGEVDPIRHLIGSAAGWGGLPDAEAIYLNVDPGLPVGRYRIRVGAVPVDAFWSISVYNAEGYFEANDRGVYSVNSVTATPDADGTVTVHLGGCEDDRPNCIPIVDGWNYLVRLYRPRPEVLDGSWTFPSAEPVA